MKRATESIKNAPLVKRLFKAQNGEKLIEKQKITYRTLSFCVKAVLNLSYTKTTINIEINVFKTSFSLIAS
jgi:hypothetical protein